MFFIEYSERVSGKALFTSVPFLKDEIIYTLTGKISTIRTKYTIEIGINKHILDNFGMYMNHSSFPTVKIKGNSVIAIRDIMPGEEINFDYNQSESLICSPFIDNETGVYISGSNRLVPIQIDM